MNNIEAQKLSKSNSIVARWCRKSNLHAVSVVIVALSFVSVSATAHEEHAVKNLLRVGASKIDISVASEKRPDLINGINDHTFVRAIVIGNGETKAVLVTADVGGIRTETWSNVSQRMERELSIPVDQLALMATHTHSMPRLSGKQFEDQIFTAIQLALSKLEPAEMAWGEGQSYINVNRNTIDKKTNGWWEGPNYDGPSDKTVSVMAFNDLKGKPIAIVYNYAVHAVLNGMMDKISGDIPGASSRYIESYLGGDVIALWSEGAAGDQNPIFFQQTYDLREIRIKDYAKKGKDISNAMPPGGMGLDKKNPRVVLLMDQQAQMTVSMGQMLGEEVLHTLRSNMERPRKTAVIDGASMSVECPGRTRTNKGRAGYSGAYVESDPVAIKLSMIRIGQTMIGGVDAEVFNMIAQRFKRESPYKHSMMSTLTNGWAPTGYIPNDAAFGYETFEVLSSRLQPGCAESAIVNGLLDLIEVVEE
ncbi:MAG: hypothetical protein COB36_12865 [Alphaproteobacteria bacterium]|nr:MAG: hypothetical protein COB36_12865 [Alphaproteobacteria bacterium]